MNQLFGKPEMKLKIHNFQIAPKTLIIADNTAGLTLFVNLEREVHMCKVSSI